MASMNIKKGDNVVVLVGKDNGKTGEVLECFPQESKVTVKGMNMISKHKKPRSAQDKGGIIRKEGKIDVSDVMIICPVCGKATRVAHKENEKGEKVRVCKKCGASLDSGVKKPVEKKAEKKVEKVEKTEEVKAEAAEKKPAKTTKSTTKRADTQVKTTKSVKTVKKSPSTTKKIGGK